MANLFQRSRSPFWWISYTTATGRVRVSTGIRHENRTKPTPSVLELRRTIEERQARSKFGVAAMIEAKPVTDYLTGHLANLQGLRESTRGRYSYTVKAFTSWLAGEKLALMADVNYPVAARYVAHRRTSGIGPGTLRNDVQFLRAAWDEAKKLHFCDFEENPWTFTFKQDQEEKQPFTDTELAALLAAPMPDWMRLAVDIARYTGARSSSIKGLRWEDITDTVIHFRISKTTAFTMPLHPRLAFALQPHRKPSGSVMPDELLTKSRTYFSTMFKGVCERAGVPRAHFHLFRHTFISRLAQAGVEQRVTQLLANHSSADVHRHYTHSQADALAPHLARLTYADSVPMVCPMPVAAA